MLGSSSTFPDLETISPRSCGFFSWGMVGIQTKIWALVMLIAYWGVSTERQCMCVCVHTYTCISTCHNFISTFHEFLVISSIPTHRIHSNLSPFHSNNSSNNETLTPITFSVFPYFSILEYANVVS